jgi:hypothetical protein
MGFRPAVLEQEMRRLAVAVSIFASLGLSAQAGETPEISLKNKALASAAITPADTKIEAPFAYGRDPMPQLLMQEEQERRGPRGACEAAASDLCFDAAERRVVYRPARKLMPQLDGLTAESVSLRANRITFKYSFR